LSRKTLATEIAERVKNLADPVATAAGYELVEIEYVMDHGRPVVRIYIDTVPPGDDTRGVSVEDCTAVSRLVGELLDADETVVPGEYHLEVSSPGLFRPLTRKAHFERVLGQRVRVKTYDKRDGRRVFVGPVRAIDDVEVTVEVDGTAHRIPLEAVAKANLEPELEF
jgi:ribosome maturation factor RimP